MKIRPLLLAGLLLAPLALSIGCRDRSNAKIDEKKAAVAKDGGDD